MKPTIFLRIAAVLTLVMAVLHTIGGVFGTPDPGPATVAVTAMQANHFNVMGHDRTYWNFFIGFGLCMTVSLVVEGVAFWLLASLARQDAARLRPILGVFCLSYLATAVLSFRYFFLPPVVSNLLIALMLGLAFFTAKQPAVAG